MAAFIAMSWELSRLDGWNAWAAASAMMYPVVLSAVMGLIGAVLWLREWRSGRRAVSLAFATLLASSVAVWFLVRVAALELARSS